MVTMSTAYASPSLRCSWCGEQIYDPGSGSYTEVPHMVPHTSGYLTQAGTLSFHPECSIRQVVGSVACQMGECRRLGGSGCGDDPRLTMRQAAQEAAAYSRRLECARAVPNRGQGAYAYGQGALAASD